MPDTVQDKITNFLNKLKEVFSKYGVQPDLVDEAFRTEGTFVAFLSMLMTEDDLGRAVRVHLLVEGIIRRFVLSKLVKPKAFEKNLDYLQFTALINLAAGLGLKEDFLAPAIAVNRIRNEFAHRTRYELTKQDVDDLLNASNGYLRTILNDLASKHEQGPAKGLEEFWSTPTTGMQFALVGVFLIAKMIEG